MTDSRNAMSWWAGQGIFIRKELRETLRDRRTIVTLLAMPLLLYPMLGLVFRLVATPAKGALGSSPSIRLVVASTKEGTWLAEALAIGERLEPTIQPISSQTPNSKDEPPRIEFLLDDRGASTDLSQPLLAGDADLAARVVFPGSASDTTASVRVSLIHSPDFPASVSALRLVERRLLRFNTEFLRERSENSGGPRQVPVEFTLSAVAGTATRSMGLVSLLPLVLLLMTVTGGVYPAIDLTAGERERDTLETLFALPVPRVRLLLAKYVAVLVVTLLTGLMNLLAMAATVFSLRLDAQLFGESGLTFSLVAKLLLVLVVFGMFYSAVLLAITSAARSFKEAQAYLIPLMLMSLAPGLVILLPGWRLEGWTSVAPLLNMLLLAREMFEGTAEALPACGALLSTFLYTLSALAVAAQWFGTDAVAVGSRGGWGEWTRRSDERSLTPSMTAAVVVLAALFPLNFFASGVLGRLFDEFPAARLIAAGCLTLLLFGAVPAIAGWWRRVDGRLTWALQAPRPTVLLGGVILGLGTWPWVYEAILATQTLGIEAIDEEKKAVVEKLLAAWAAVPLPLIVLAMGVIPGVCEELFFRGYFFAGLRRSLGGAGTVVATAIAFGIFHIVLAGGAAPERIVPSTILGLLLGWVRIRGGSIWPGAVLHVCHNSTLLVMTRYREQLADLPLAATAATHLPLGWLGASAGAIVIGIVLVAWGSRELPPAEESRAE